VNSYGGNIIYGQYDGVAAYDWDTGKVSWLYQNKQPYAFETVYQDSYPFFTSGYTADGKFYIVNTEHTPSQPITRGWCLCCINATTGEEIWKIKGTMSPGGIADGYLTASNGYDGYMYVFGKGKTATTVTAPDVVMPKGNGIVIRGTVLDQSPAQPNTPCVSKDSMQTQMEYLHMQQPIDGLLHNVTMTGVPVSLTAIDSNNNYVNIGTVTTSAYYGTFEMAWTPPAEGTYKIVASFTGDDSYGSSGASTAISVGPAPTQVTIPEQIVPYDYTMTLIGGFLAVIIAIAIVGVLVVFRKK
jgi:outer membrane protein assembly factor BamB